MELIVTKDRYEQALEYQDLATDILCSHGYNVNCYCSKKYQYEKGESRNGIEIKNDTLVSSTGNLYIETHEKQKEATKWIKSGILREDNTKYWFIGDNKKAWFFSKKQLKTLVFKKEFQKKETATSRGVLIPIKYLEQHPSIVLEAFNVEEELMIQENMNHITI